MGLQAANPIKTLQTQTYFNRSVNACLQNDPKDSIDKIREQSGSGGDINDKLDKFIDRV